MKKENFLDKNTTIFIFFIFIYYLIMINISPLLEPDEGRYIEIPREMLFYKDFILPRLNGVLYFEKPPLYYWLNAISFSIFGVSNLSARVVNVIFSVFTIMFTGFLAKKLFNIIISTLSQLVLATTFLYMVLTCTNTIDLLLTFFITVSIGSFFIAIQNENNINKKYFYFMFAASAGAVLTKGLIGIVIPGLIIFIFFLFSKKWRLLLKVPWFTGILLFLLIAAPWHILAALKNDKFLYFYFVREHFLRYTTTISERVQPWYYFIIILILGSIPFTHFLPKVFKNFYLQLKNNEKPFIFYIFLWFLVPILFFSISKSKLATYILPVFPPLSVLIAFELSKKLKNSKDIFNFKNIKIFIPSIIMLILFLILQISINFLRDDGELKNAANFIKNINSKHNFQVFSYEIYPQTLSFYLESTIGILGEKGELTFGVNQLNKKTKDERFPSIELFKKKCSKNNKYLIITKRKKLKKLKKDGINFFKPVWEGKTYIVLSNF